MLTPSLPSASISYGYRLTIACLVALAGSPEQLRTIYIDLNLFGTIAEGCAASVAVQSSSGRLPVVQLHDP